MKIAEMMLQPSQKHSTKEPSEELSLTAVLVWFLLFSRTDRNKPVDATLLLQAEGSSVTLVSFIHEENHS